MIILFIAEVTGLTQLTMRPYRISKVAELCVNYNERKLFQFGRVARKEITKIGVEVRITHPYAHLEHDFLAEAC